MQPKAENRIMIYGPKDDGTFWVEFKTDQGASLVISVPSGETPCCAISRLECLMD
jgi:hypothetical protein